MSREKQFSEAEVLESAADVFSSHGYQGTSLAMLLEATGLGKQSLYNAFGDKRELYLKALDCAVARYAGVLARMNQAADGRTAVQVYFEDLVGKCGSSEPVRKSCIVSSGLLEAIDDAAISHRLREKWAGTHEMLRAAIERGQKDGSIRNRAPSAELADLLVSIIGGLRVNARADFPAARMRRIAHRALALLDQAEEDDHAASA